MQCTTWRIYVHNDNVHITRQQPVCELQCALLFTYILLKNRRFKFKPAAGATCFVCACTNERMTVNSGLSWNEILFQKRKKIGAFDCFQCIFFFCVKLPPYLQRSCLPFQWHPQFKTWKGSLMCTEFEVAFKKKRAPAMRTHFYSYQNEWFWASLARLNALNIIP